MEKINRYPLDSKRVVDYIIDQLDLGGSLAYYIRENFDFSSGSFYTLLPDTINVDQLVEFSNGGILPILPRECDYERIPNVDEEVLSYLWNICDKKKCCKILIEDILTRITDRDIEIPGTKIIADKDKVYYLIEFPFDQDTLLSAFKTGNQIWYSLGLVINDVPIDCDNFNNECFKIICDNVSYMYFGAYDGEGYIFWERNT